MDQHEPAAPSTSPSASIRKHLPDGFEPASMLKTLLDYRFTRFITVNIIQVLYVIGAAVALFFTLASVVISFQAGAVMGILALLFAPVVFLIYVLILRVYLELIVVIFRIAENTRISAEASSKP